MSLGFQRENCIWCNDQIEQVLGGRERAYCSTACRVAACRARKKMGNDHFQAFLRLAPTRGHGGNPASWWFKLHENHTWWGWETPDWPVLLKERKKRKTSSKCND